MKRILVSVIIMVGIIGVFTGCMMGNASSSVNSAPDSGKKILNGQIAESCSSYGYAFLHKVKKGGSIS